MRATRGPHWIDWSNSGCGRMIGPTGGGRRWLIMSPRPGWRNGIRGRLKPVCPKGHRGSTPLSGTALSLPLFPREGPGSAPPKHGGRVRLESGLSRRSGFKHLRFRGALPGPSRSLPRPVPEGESKAYVLAAHSCRLQVQLIHWVVCDHRGPDALASGLKRFVCDHKH